MGILGLYDFTNFETTNKPKVHFLDKCIFDVSSWDFSNLTFSHLQSHNHINGYYPTSIPTITPIKFCVDCIYQGLDWTYTFFEANNIYEINFYYFQFMDSIFDDSFEVFFNTYWFLSVSTSFFQLFWAFLIDNYFLSNLYKSYFTEEWYRSVLASNDICLAIIFKPELSLIHNQFFFSNYLNYWTELTFLLYDFLKKESFLVPILLLPGVAFNMYIALLLVIFYFSYYTTSVKDEAVIDSDFLIANCTVESEKEIGSLEDISLGMMFIIYIYGWYFYIFFWQTFSAIPEIVFVFYLFPALFYIIVAIPTFLSYDFGIYYLSYLRGVGPSSALVAELMYDYIAFIAFYIRLLVQGVRLILMIFTYASMHDYVIYYCYDTEMMFGNDNIWEEISKLRPTIDSVSYFFILVMPGKILYWVYEIFHTFFVITGQFIAFFAMVFWLFLFLYSFFVFEKHEAYFQKRRLFRKKILDDLKKLK